MANPILAMLQRPASKQNNMLSALSMVKNIMSGNPSQAFEMEMKNNPQFAQFVRDHQNMNVNDLLSQAGIDANILQALIK